MSQFRKDNDKFYGMFVRKNMSISVLKRTFILVLSRLYSLLFSRSNSF